MEKRLRPSLHQPYIPGSGHSGLPPGLTPAILLDALLVFPGAFLLDSLLAILLDPILVFLGAFLLASLLAFPLASLPVH